MPRTKAFPLLIFQFRASDIAALGIAINVFGYDDVFAVYDLPDLERMRYVLCHRSSTEA